MSGQFLCTANPRVVPAPDVGPVLLAELSIHELGYVDALRFLRTLPSCALWSGLAACVPGFVGYCGVSWSTGCLAWLGYCGVDWCSWLADGFSSVPGWCVRLSGLCRGWSSWLAGRAVVEAGWYCGVTKLWPGLWRRGLGWGSLAGWVQKVKPARKLSGSWLAGLLVVLWRAPGLRRGCD